MLAAASLLKSCFFLWSMISCSWWYLMLILIAPAKRMRPTIDFMDHKRMPCFLSESERLVTYLKTKKQEELKAMLNCSDAIAEWTYNSYQHMDVNVSCVPALLSFDGIQYSYMAPDLFSCRTAYSHFIRLIWYSGALWRRRTLSSWTGQSLSYTLLHKPIWFLGKQALSTAVWRW